MYKTASGFHSIETKMFIEIMFNKCFGGFGFSSKALRLYCELTGASEPSSRHDPVMVSIVKDLGREANGHGADIAFESISAKFENYYEIQEYDGIESVHIRHSDYKINVAKTILADETLSHAERVERARALLSTKDDDL